jgi:uncharacterized membrane protein
MKRFDILKAPSRLKSLDILRGAIMVLMAIDHVRVYAGVPAGSPEPAVFFTRWITHFCAPGFVFFTGVSAFFYEQKVKSKNELSKFLLIGAFTTLLSPLMSDRPALVALPSTLCKKG